MTVHWLNPNSVKREKAVLGIKEICAQQTGDYLAKAMMELHQEFGLSGKVISTTTDNGANYGAAFKIMFAGTVEDVEEVGKFFLLKISSKSYVLRIRTHYYFFADPHLDPCLFCFKVNN
jgi:hypothetical protein